MDPFEPTRIDDFLAGLLREGIVSTIVLNNPFRSPALSEALVEFLIQDSLDTIVGAALTDHISSSADAYYDVLKPTGMGCAGLLYDAVIEGLRNCPFPIKDLVDTDVEYYESRWTNSGSLYLYFIDHANIIGQLYRRPANLRSVSKIPIRLGNTRF